MTHHHLSRDERVALSVLLRAGHTQSACARQLGVHRSTISRELRRASGDYRVATAERHARSRRRDSKRTHRKIENDAKLRNVVTSLLKKGRSPEQIAREVKTVSDDAIYAWVKRSEKAYALLLPQRGRRRHRYGKAKDGGHQGWTKWVRNIAERPGIVERRDRIGDWEGDTVLGRDRARLLVYVDRKSRFTVACVIPDGGADTVHAATKNLFKGLPCHTITYDRGSEFALWRMIEKDIKTRIYFANAHHPWERGTSENTNGLLRRFFPKGEPLGQRLRKDIIHAVRLLNHRPRKCLNWKTPCHVFRHCCNSD